MLTTKEVAQKLQKSEQTIRTWIRSGKLKATKHDGKWQIEESSLPNQKVATHTEPQSTISISQIADILEKGLSGVVSKMENIINQTTKGEEPQDNVTEEKFKELEEQNQQLQRRIEEQSQKMLSIEQYIKQLESRLESIHKPQQTQQIKKEEQPTQPPKTESKPKRKATLENEDSAEQWVWNNVNQWLYKPSGLKNASKRTWKELAQNTGAKIWANGQEISSRELLEQEANSEEKSWYRVKAKAALQLIEDQSSYCHYNHPVEIGGC